MVMTSLPLLKAVYVGFKSFDSTVPFFFDIGWISEFPEEGEWLMLPGLFPLPQFTDLLVRPAHQARFDYGDITAWLMRDAMGHSGYHMPNPDHPNAGRPQFDGIRHSLASRCKRYCISILCSFILMVVTFIIILIITNWG